MADAVANYLKRYVNFNEKELRESLLMFFPLRVRKEAPCYSEKEREVLSFAEALTFPVPDPLLSFFSKKAVNFLPPAVAETDSWSRLMKIFRIAPGNYQVKK